MGAGELDVVPRPLILLELLAASEGPRPPGSPLAIQPVVVDTNILLGDIRHRLRSGRETALIEAARVGTLRPFVARHLPGFARKQALDEGRAWEVWRTAYVPLLRVVDVPTDLADPRIAQVRAADADDVPTAALAVLIAPCLVLSEDGDLARPGLTSARPRRWVDLLLHGLAAARGDQALLAAGTAAAVGLAVLRQAVGTIVDAGWGRTAALTLAGLGLGLAWGGRLSGERLARVAGQFVPILDEFHPRLTAYLAGRAALVDAAIAPWNEVDLQQAIAQHLATAPLPRSATEIAASLRRQGRRVAVPAVDALLRANPAFVEVGRRRWQLGRAGAAGPMMFP